MNDNKQELVDRYICNQMSPEERHEFEKEIQTDAELKELYEYTQNVKSALISRNEKLHSIQNWKKKKSNKKIVYRVIGVAALFVGVAVLMLPPVVYNDGNIYQAPGSENFHKQMDWGESPTFRGGQDLNDIYQLLEQENYNLALVKINEKLILKMTENKEPVQPSELTKEERERLEYERSVMELDAEELYWLKAKALLGLNRKEEALLVLEHIQNIGGLYQGKANELYQKLKNENENENENE